MVTSSGERLFAGGPLGLYELSHAIVPGAPLTVFTAKKGVRVELVTSGIEQEQEQEQEGGSASALKAHKIGVLSAPLRLLTTSLKSSAGGETNSLPREMVSSGKVVWGVLFDNGETGEYVVGTEASDTCLKVCLITQSNYMEIVMFVQPFHVCPCVCVHHSGPIGTFIYLTIPPKT